MKNTLRTAGFFLLTIVLFTSCRKEWHDEILPGNKLFVSATPIGLVTKTQLQIAAAEAGYGVFAPLAKYDAFFYKIIYKTSFKGKLIQASGLLGVPVGMPGTPSLLSAQHGTIFKYVDAPSNFPLAFTGFELFASAGFVTTIPDYIGFGVSQGTTHPYYDQESSGLTVTDMIKAVKYFLQTQNKAITNRLFLVGYSEGGYVTMAAQKEIETTPSHQLKVTAAAEGAGGYDLNTFVNILADTNYYATPSVLTLLIKGYNDTYNWNRPYTDFYQQPYASQLPALLNGTKSRTEVDAALPKVPANLFNPSFYAGLNDPGRELTLKLFLAGNSFLTWAPKSPTRLYHGTADETVFFQTSVTTFARFKALGAPDVTFYPVPGGTHATTIIPMMANVFPWFQSLDQ